MYAASNFTADVAVRIAMSHNPNIQAAYDQLDIAATERLFSKLLKNP
jgi:hypothetical protein